MSFITAVRYGDWTRFSRGALYYINQHAKMEDRVVRKAAEVAQKLLIANIQSGGSLAGKPFVANTPATIARKGSAAPLIESGQLSSAGSFRIRMLGPGVSLLTVSRPSENTGIELGGLHEVGEAGAGFFGSDIPARPWFTPTIQSDRLTAEITVIAADEFLRLIRQSFGAF